MSSLSAKAAVFVPGKSWQSSPVSVGMTGAQPQQLASAGPPEFVPGMPWAGGDAMYPAQPQQWSNGDEQVRITLDLIDWYPANSSTYSNSCCYSGRNESEIASISHAIP